MQVGLLRLTTLAAKLAPGSSTTEGSRLMLWFLQCLLAHCLSAINTFVAGEVQAVLGPRPDVMDRYLGKGASLCSRQAREPGEAGDSQGHNPLMVEDMVPCHFQCRYVNSDPAARQCLVRLA